MFMLRLAMMSREKHRVIEDAVPEVVPKRPSNRPAPAGAFVEAVATPVPARAAPAAIVPAIAVAFEPVVFGLRKFGIAAAGSAFLRPRPRRPRHVTGDPGLAFQIVALRQHERRSWSSVGAIDRDAQARGGNYQDRGRIIVERLQ